MSAAEQHRGSTVVVRGPDGSPVALRPTAARLLQALWLDHEHEVAVATLIERVWGDEPPGDAVGSLHQTVARLRRALPDADIARTADGYRLVLPEHLTVEAQHAPDPAATSAPHPPAAAPARHDHPLIGRDALLWAATAAAAAGTGTVFHGTAGNGRTRMVEEVVAALARDGRRAAVLHGRATGPTMPLGAFAPLLPDVIPQRGVSMVVAAREAIVGQLQGEQLVLGIDDLHLIDASSAALASQLVTTGAAVLIGSYRNMAVVPEAVAMLWHEDFCRHVHVPVLDRASTRLLIEATVPTPVDDQLVEEVWSLTLGNPLFVTTVLAQMNLGQGNTVGSTGAGNEAVIDRLVAEQLSGVPADLRDALTVIALAEPIGAAIVEQLCDPHALVALERRLLIRPERHGRRIDVSMRHPLYGAHLRATASQLLARGIRNQLIDHLVALGAKRADDLRQLIDWSTASGRALPPDVAVRAAWYALRHGDPLHAERLGRRVWDDTGSVAAALVVCEARYAWGDGRAIHALAEAAASAAGGDVAGAAVARLAEVDRRTTTWKVGGDVPAPIEELEPIGATMAHVARARFADAEAALRAFLATEPLRRPDELAVASAMLGWTMGWRGRPATGTAIAADAARALTASGHRPLARWAWIFTGDVAVAAGDHPVIDEAIAALTGPSEHGEETPTSFDTWIDIVVAGRHRLLHEFEASRSLLRVAADRARAQGRWFDEVIALHDQVRSGSEADEVVERLHALATDGRELAGMLARQASSESSDDVDGMVAITDELVAAGVLGYAAEALARAGELAAAAGDRRRARELGIRWQELMDQCERPAVPPPILTIEALTVREREVALLGMDGHTSRAIAERLGLSVRTVDNHLAHVFTKLGITSRSELVDALTRLQVH